MGKYGALFPSFEIIDDDNFRYFLNTFLYSIHVRNFIFPLIFVATDFSIEGNKMVNNAV